MKSFFDIVYSVYSLGILDIKTCRLCSNSSDVFFILFYPTLTNPIQQTVDITQLSSVASGHYIYIYIYTYTYTYSWFSSNWLQDSDHFFHPFSYGGFAAPTIPWPHGRRRNLKNCQGWLVILGRFCLNKKWDILPKIHETWCICADFFDPLFLRHT